MSEQRDQAKAAFAAWMTSNLERLDMTQLELSRRVGVSPNTISRYCKPDDKFKPKLETVKKIFVIFNDAPPASYLIESQADHDAQGSALQLLPEDGLHNWNGSISRWRVLDNSMQSMGFLANDIIAADSRIAPAYGDAVIAILYVTADPVARTVLRLFKGPDRLVTPHDEDAFIIGKNAAMFGVVVETIRRRTPH
jgi:transcriptional regulator with XRE-family HTH domain